MINPNAIPVEILEVKGIARMIINAVNASSNSDHLIFLIPSIIKQPTIIRTGAVMEAKLEIAEINGEKNKATTNNRATTTEVKPVRPPAATPVVDST